MWKQKCYAFNQTIHSHSLRTLYNPLDMRGLSGIVG